MDGSIETPLFMAESGEKNGKIIMEKKRRKKWKFSPYSVPFFLHITGSIETPLFMAESGEKSGYFLHIHFRFFSIKAEINMEKKRRMNMEKLWTSIIFSIRSIEIQACKWLGAS